MNKRIIYLIGILFLFLTSTNRIAYAAVYYGDDTYTVKQGDTITGNNGYYVYVKEISWALQGDTEPKITFMFDESYVIEPLHASETANFTTAAMGGSKVLEVVVNSINKEDSTAQITLYSIHEEEEQPNIPLPEEGKTYAGDGNYTLNVDDKVISNTGYKIKFTGIKTIDIRFEKGVKVAELEVYSKSNDFLFKEDVEIEQIYMDFHDIGLTVYPLEFKTDSIVLKVSSGLTINFNEGWNLFSVPLYWYAGSDSCQDAKCYGPGTNGLKILENNCGDLDKLKIWHWDSEQKQYYKTLPYTPFGYWIKINKECSITFGQEIVNFENYDLKLKKGWNQIGGPTKSIFLNDLGGDCNITSGPWLYSTQYNRYEKAISISSGEGYFIKVSDDCTLGRIKNV